MTVVQSLLLEDWSGQHRSVRLLSSANTERKSRYYVTTITGTNGSYKSTFLKELVSTLVLNKEKSSATFLDPKNQTAHVVCMSGSVADRFPSKEGHGRGGSEYDVPNYAYLGQRVGSNLLSKKRPLETMLSFALDESRSHRASWDFYSRAHKLAGIQNTVEYVVERKHRVRKGERLDVLDKLLALANGKKVKKDDSYPKVSRETAAWLLQEFDNEDFLSLQEILESPRKGIRLKLSSEGADIESDVGFGVGPVRLGLLTDLLGLSEVNVKSLATGRRFSAYDLSSGEYHIYCSLLGLGFGMRDESVVLIDEPENSLHPQWQQEFMDAALAIGDAFYFSGHIIICTHSPLIVAATPKGAAVVDLSIGSESSAQSNFGASCDEILLSQFGVASGRNRVVVETIQKAVSLVERGDFRNAEFLNLRADLEAVKTTLRKDDPLVDVIDALLEDQGE